jgi:predicted nucleotidyltransferase
MLDKTDEKAPQNKTPGKNTKRDKFVKLAEARTKTAIKAIRTVAKLGNKNAYDFSGEDVKRIVSALNREVEALKARMSQSGGKESVEFSL